jgi:hypothetical protein
MPASRRQDPLFGWAVLIHHRGSAAVVVGMAVSDRFSDRQMTDFSDWSVPASRYSRKAINQIGQFVAELARAME